MDTNGNGSPELPEDRKAAVQYGLEQFQAIAAERDKLQRENFTLKSELALLRMECEAQASQITDAKSNVETAWLTRDQAVAHCVKWETLFRQMSATMRAFEVPAEPFIKEADDQQTDVYPRATVD